MSTHGKTIPLSEPTKFVVDNRGKTAPTAESGIALIATNCISNDHLYPQYINVLAAFVDEKMRAAAESTPSGDSVRLAVLAALNIADELFRCQDAQQAGRGALAERTEALERLVDAALAT